MKWVVSSNAPSTPRPISDQLNKTWVIHFAPFYYMLPEELRAKVDRRATSARRREMVAESC